MTYATLTQIQLAAGGADRLVEMADWDADGAIDAGVVEDAQAAAEAWMHEWLRLRFLVPVVPTTPEGAATLARISAAETVYRILSRRRFAGKSDHDGHEERERELKGFADGHRRPDEPLPGKSSAVVAAIVPNTSCTSRDALKDVL